MISAINTSKEASKYIRIHLYILEIDASFYLLQERCSQVQRNQSAGLKKVNWIRYGDQKRLKSSSCLVHRGLSLGPQNWVRGPQKRPWHGSQQERPNGHDQMAEAVRNKWSDGLEICFQYLAVVAHSLCHHPTAKFVLGCHLIARTCC